MQQLPLGSAGPAQKEKRGKASGPVGREMANGPKMEKRVGRENNSFSFSKSSFPNHFQTEF
jgi:hypothetical protein